MNKRKLNLSKYGISGKRYKELCGFCEQYPEWKKALCDMDSAVKSPIISDMPVAHNGSDSTASMAMKRMELSEKIDLIENTAKQASPEFYRHIIKSACYEVPVTYLITCDNLYCGKSKFYELRRYFFYLLDRNKKF